MSKRATQTSMHALLDLGQSVWLDYLRRGMLRSGELQSLIDDGLRGMTSNPTIFEHAIGGSGDYDEQHRPPRANARIEVVDRRVRLTARDAVAQDHTEYRGQQQHARDACEDFQRL